MKKFFLLISVFFGIMIFVLPAQATTLTFGLDFEFSEADEPEGPAPWLTATFDDENTPGSVTLTMTASNLIDAEYVDLWCFNFDPSLILSLLEFSYLSDSTGPSAVYSTSATEQEFKADGGGYFDIQFEFPNSNSGVDRFTAGESSIWGITGTGIIANSFNFLSDVSGGHGTWLTAAHVGAIDITGDDNDGSGWVGATVPEPSTMLLLGFGLVGLAAVGRKKFH